MRYKRQLLILLLLFFITPVVTADEDDFNVDVFFGWGGCYRPMEWTPVEINIQTDLVDPFEGTLHVSARQDELNNLQIAHSFVLTPEIPRHIPLVMKIAYAADKCSVRITNNRGRTEWNNSIDLWDFSGQSRTLTVVNENDLLIGLIGKRSFGLLQLDKDSACVTDSNRGKVYVEDKVPRMAPWDWTGYMSLDLLVLYDPDWSLFNRQQIQAIADWISNGGRVLLMMGLGPMSVENPIARILPFQFDQPKNTELTSPFLSRYSLNGESPESVVCQSISPRADQGIFSIDSSGDAGVIATAYAGFGRVGICAFDPATMSDIQKPTAARFWVSLINTVLRDSSNRDFVKPTEEDLQMNRYDRRKQNAVIPLNRSIEYVKDVENDKESVSFRRHQPYAISYSQTASNSIMEFLYTIAEMRPLSIWWVILLLTLLAILLGPIDYIVLKRKGLLPLTWITSSLWILIFSVGAYYGVQALRGGKMQTRSVSVIDGIEGSDNSWSTSYSGLFAPRSDDYVPAGFNEMQKEKHWWSGVSPTQDYLYSYTQQTGSRNILCVQKDGSNIPYSLPINIWTIQCTMNEHAAGRLPIRCKLRKDGSEYVLTITNLSEYPISKGYVLLDETTRLAFTEVAPMETKEFVGRGRSQKSWTEVLAQQLPNNVYSSNFRFFNEAAYVSQGVLGRTQTILSYLSHGAAVVCAQYDDAPAPMSIKDRTGETTHLQLVRQVVFPQ